jgi:membrane protease YdiL (CAAX protease family)
MSESPETPRNIGTIAILFEGGVVVLALAICWYCGEWPPLASKSWSGNAVLLVWGLVATLPLVAGLVVLDRYPVGPLAELKRFVETNLAPLFAGVTLPQMALISLAAGLGEELLFRGLLQTAVAEWAGPPLDDWIGLIVATIVFGACHWVTTTYFLLAALMGLYFGLLFIVTGDLLIPIVAHGLYDFVALIYLIKRKPETPREVEGDATDATVDAEDD